MSASTRVDRFADITLNPRVKFVEQVASVWASGVRGRTGASGGVEVLRVHWVGIRVGRGQACTSRASLVTMHKTASSNGVAAVCVPWIGSIVGIASAGRSAVLAPTLRTAVEVGVDAGVKLVGDLGGVGTGVPGAAGIASGCLSVRTGGCCCCCRCRSGLSAVLGVDTGVELVGDGGFVGACGHA
jgi:hypothetical protein